MTGAYQEAMKFADGNCSIINASIADAANGYKKGVVYETVSEALCPTNAFLRATQSRTLNRGPSFPALVAPIFAMSKF
jgi:hypothetical protein